MRAKWNDALEASLRLSRVFTFFRMCVMHFDLRAVEYMLAFIGVTTGLWVGWPWQNMYQSDTVAYKLLVDFMPSWAWTCSFVLAGAPSIFFSSDKWWKRVARLTGMAMLLTVWVLASLLFALDKAPYLATAWTPVFVFYQAWALLQAWLDHDRYPKCLS